MGLVPIKAHEAMQIKKPYVGPMRRMTNGSKPLLVISLLILSSFLKEYFIGFIEPNKITSGDCDIIVSDGYTGNIMLKSAEGISNFITSNLKSMFKKSLINKLAYKLIEKDLKRIWFQY